MCRCVPTIDDIIRIFPKWKEIRPARSAGPEASCLVHPGSEIAPAHLSLPIVSRVCAPSGRASRAHWHLLVPHWPRDAVTRTCHRDRDRDILRRGPSESQSAHSV
jgi:hypothetical protein